MAEAYKGTYRYWQVHQSHDSPSAERSSIGFNYFFKMPQFLRSGLLARIPCHPLDTIKAGPTWLQHVDINMAWLVIQWRLLTAFCNVSRGKERCTHHKSTSDRIGSVDQCFETRVPPRQSRLQSAAGSQYRGFWHCQDPRFMLMVQLALTCAQCIVLFYDFLCSPSDIQYR